MLSVCLLVGAASAAWVGACADAMAQPRSSGRHRAPTLEASPVAPAVVPTEANPYATSAEDNPYTAESPEQNPYAASASAPDAVEEDAPASTASTTTPASPEPANLRVKFHALGLGFHSTAFATQSGYGFTLMGPSVVYDYFVGRTWGFAMRAEAYFPMSGRMAGNGESFRANLIDAYSDRRYGFDGSFMVAYRRAVTPSLVLVGAAGLHVQSFRLVDATYNPIEAITGGIALMGRAEYRLLPWLSIGGEVAIGIDPLDFVQHRNRATVTVPITPSFFVGFSY